MKIDGYYAVKPTDSSEELYDSVEHVRTFIRRKNVNLLSTPVEPGPLEKGTEMAGRFDETVDGVKFECFMRAGNPGKPLYVFLNGSIFGKPPEFKRWSYYKYFDGTLLNIADPMYRMYPGLRLGWYWGDKDVNLMEKVAKLICNVRDRLGLTETVIVGSSAGGVCAIQASARIENCKVVLVNPQLRLDIYSHRGAFEGRTGVNLDEDDPFSRNDVVRSFSPDCKYVLFFNLASEDDRRQLDHLMGHLGVKAVYGLNCYGNITAWTYVAPGKRPHNNQEYYPMVYILDWAVSNYDDLPKYRNVSKLLNEFWYDHYELKDTIDRMKDNTLADPIRSSTEMIEMEFVPSGKKWIQGKIADIETDTRYMVQVERCFTGDPDRSVTICVKNDGKNLSSTNLSPMDGKNNTVVVMGNMYPEGSEIRIYPHNPDDLLTEYMAVRLNITRIR
ncbi:MAG: alpha/beta hydrolase [archaeon]|nr:alpha/beta hydrolase [archaeon]